MLAASAIDGLLDALKREGFGVGLRERLLAHQLAQGLASCGRPADARDPDTRAMFASLLARSEDELVKFTGVWQRVMAVTDAAAPDAPPRPVYVAQPELNWWQQLARRGLARRIAYAAMAVIAVAALTLAANRLWQPSGGSTPNPGPVMPRDPTMPEIKPDAAVSPTAPAPEQPKVTAQALVDAYVRLIEEGLGDGAPTPRELWDQGWPANAGVQMSLARFVRETGLEPDIPWYFLSVSSFSPSGTVAPVQGALKSLVSASEPGNVDVTPPAATLRSMASALFWAMGAEAPERREWNVWAQRLRSVTWSDVSRAAAELGDDSVDEWFSRSPDRAMRILGAQVVPSRLDDPTADGSRRGIAANVALESLRVSLGENSVLLSESPVDPPKFLKRALFIALRNTPETRHLATREYFPDGPWWPKPVAAAQFAPAWVPWVAGGLPLIVLMWGLARRGRHRRHYLEGRLPATPPDLTAVALAAPRRLAQDFAVLSKLSHALQARIPEPTTRLDLAATAIATARAGGLFTPIHAIERRPPDYIALIETQGPGDQDAQRLDMLVDRLAAADVEIERFYFTGDPRILRPHGGGPAVHLETLAALRGDDRLILMGEASGLVDDITLAPKPWCETLRMWQRRAMLTPVPLAGWGQRTFAIARELDMPIGRATLTGLVALVDLLGLDGSEDRPAQQIYETAETAHVLPHVLRTDAARYISQVPIDDSHWQDLASDLEDYLGRPGFLWLSALAIYPALQWDVTLYLGINLEDEDGQPLYSEPRTAALTRLPWLREGQMPAWLRRRLIAELPAAIKARAIALLWQLMRGKATGADGDSITLNLAQADAPLRRPLDAPIRDDVLREAVFIDALNDQPIPDLAFELPDALQDTALARFVDRARVTWIDAAGGTAALATAAVAWWLAPKPWDGPLTAGAYVPLAVLMASSLVMAALVRPWGANPLGTRGRQRSTSSRHRFGGDTTDAAAFRLVDRSARKRSGRGIPDA